MTATDDDVAQPPPVLYHYTNWNGLEGIFRDRQLWLTHFDCLNDRTEVEYMAKLLGDLVQGHPTARCAQSAIEEPGRLKYACVASLSEEGDLLSQWRAYGDKGRGFCLGFLTPQLLGAFGGTETEPRWRLKPVIYDPSEQVRILCRAIEGAGTPQHDARGACTKDCAVRQHYVDVLERWAVAFKDPHWREEREWRLWFLSAKAPPDVRPAGKKHAAFLKFPATVGADLVDRVIVGPRHHGNRIGVQATVESLWRRRANGGNVACSSLSVQHSCGTLR